MSRRRLASACLFLAACSGAPAAGADPLSYANTLIVPGESTDLSGLAFNRLGAIGSGLAYDRANNVYYAISDRGSSGGVLDYPARMQKFSLDVNPSTGAISNFHLLETIPFKTADGAAFNGIKPASPGALGLSLDPEGMAIAPNGHFFVADEYAPGIYEFQLATGAGGGTEARLVRALPVPANLVPRDKTGALAYVGNPVSGRQDNRGFEGLTISTDGSKLYGILQGPLTEEGDHPTSALPQGNGRYSRNVRIVEFDANTGANTGQYIYQMESLADVNARLPAPWAYPANAQGRSMGTSDIRAVGPNQFWVLERDDRGVTDADPLGTMPVASKRIYQINISGATNVKDTSLAGLVDLPAGVTPVAKSLLFDLQAALAADGQAIGEKYESMTFGPQLADGRSLLLIGHDNDMSMTRDATGNVPLDIYVNDSNTEARYTRLGDPSHSYGSLDLTSADLGPLPTSFHLLPNRLVAVAAVPEPGSLAALGFAALLMRRRRA